MKKLITPLILFLFIFSACQKDNINIDFKTSVEGLSLYWDHEVFGKDGRRLRFEFYETKEYENSFELVFDYRITGKEIIISLIDKIDEGKCQSYPTSNGMSSSCNSKGGIFIPDELLNEGSYSLIIKTSNFEIKSNLIIDTNKYVIGIPSNDYFSSEKTTVFPIPQDLLFGSIVFSGIENTQIANEYLKELENIGLIETSIPNYPYRHLTVDDDGKPIDKHWTPDNHSLKYLYKMNISFEDVFELSKEHFNKTKLNIYIFSSQGDQARLSKSEGIIVKYAK